MVASFSGARTQWDGKRIRLVDVFECCHSEWKWCIIPWLKQFDISPLAFFPLIINPEKTKDAILSDVIINRKILRRKLSIQLSLHVQLTKDLLYWIFVWNWAVPGHLAPRLLAWMDSIKVFRQRLLDPLQSRWVVQFYSQHSDPNWKFHPYCNQIFSREEKQTVLGKCNCMRRSWSLNPITIIIVHCSRKQYFASFFH